MPYALFPNPVQGATFVLGGARSGKSAFAEALITAHPPPWTYVATGQAWDDEMRERIAIHRAARPEGWVTIEAPDDPAAALAGAGPALIDCLTLWVTNLLLAGREPDTVRLLAALDRTHPTVLVSNEVGLGIVPDNALSRKFRDVAGLLHQAVAERADRVFLMVAGLPLGLK